MPKILTDADRQQKRQLILDAAAAEIALYGYDRANINTIAERAGIGRGTIYLYFESKDDVLGALLDTVGAAIDETIQRCIAQDLSWRDRLRALAHAFLALAGSHRDYLRVQVSALHGVNRAVGEPMARWLRTSVDRLAAAFRQAAAQGEIQPLPPETLATLVVGTLESLALLPGALHQADDPHERAETLATLLWQGIAPAQEATTQP
jgi:AcrR family transcriptional regulator